MTRRSVYHVLLILAVATCALPAAAWGPRAEVAIVGTAAHVISQDGAVRLSNLEKDIKAGASVSHEMAVKLCPAIEGDPLGAIETQMYLLKSVRGPRIDPYYAYRMGVLGKLVASETAPLADANPTYRNLYYADVENNIQEAALKPSHRVLVDSAAYFQRLKREARTQEDVILKDYQSGQGFAGAARAALSADASRSVSAVADVWNTIFTGGAVASGVSQSQMRDYLVGALEFYVQRDTLEEINQAYARLKELGSPTPDLLKRVGDMFFDAKKYDRAMKEYEAVLAVEPGRRDVMERISAYYITQGDEATKSNKLEDALAAYKKAADADQLNANAQSMRITAEKRVAERDARLANDQRTLEKGVDFENQAEKQSSQNNFVSAMHFLRLAKEQYQSVTDEFATERLAKQAGVNNVEKKIQELQTKLGSSAQNLSGSGFGSDAYYQASTAAKQLGAQTLKSMAASEYKSVARKTREGLLGVGGGK